MAEGLTNNHRAGALSLLGEDVLRILAKPTCDIPTAGRVFFDAGRNSSYRLAKDGTMPCVSVGRQLRALTAGCARKVGIIPNEAA